MHIKLGTEVYELRTGWYARGDLSLKLVDSDGGAVVELSLDVPGVGRSSDEIILKIYGENQEIAQKLVGAEVVTPTPRHILVGGHFCPICRVPGGKDLQNITDIIKTKEMAEGASLSATPQGSAATDPPSP